MPMEVGVACDPSLPSYSSSATMLSSSLLQMTELIIFCIFELKGKSTKIYFANESGL